MQKPEYKYFHPNYLVQKVKIFKTDDNGKMLKQDFPKWFPYCDRGLTYSVYFGYSKISYNKL